jgi:hypothetical protein
MSLNIKVIKMLVNVKADSHSWIKPVWLFVSLLLTLTRSGMAEIDKAETGLSLHGYGTINYQRFDWQTDPTRRAIVDLERLALEPSFQVNNWLQFQAEIEFEHGGTGSTMEFDKIEEFGEFETEVEKGGEVQIEKLCVIATLRPYLNLRLGHIFVPMGIAFILDEPVDYFTTSRSEMESNLIPVIWHETGVEIFGESGHVRYQLQIVNGLDASGFSSASWIARGHQGRFETVNAENLAGAGRLDLEPFSNVTVGLAGYWGNSADNRPKPDLKVPAHVSIGQIHTQVHAGPLEIRGLVLYGYLENSGPVSQANRNLSNNLNVKRTPVGETALGWFIESGLDILNLVHYGFAGIETSEKHQSFTLFLRYEKYDTMREMAEGYFNNPRWDRSTWTAGINYKVHPAWILKGQYSQRTIGIPTDNHENTFSLGTGFLF